MEHLDAASLEAGYAALTSPPRERGRVELAVIREPGERRVVPPKILLTRAEGVVGDRWSRAASPKLEAQVTAMRADVARLMARDGDIARFGDNLFVDLDLSEEHLPPGTLLSIGSALCAVTAKPHTGCAKFEARAGSAALAMTRDPRWKALHLRGIHLRVIEDGEIAPGAEIVVERRRGLFPG